MKPNPWIFPLLALLAIGGWIFTQKHSAATLEREITVITSRIQQARAAEDAGLKSRDAEEKARKDKERKIDWKDAAAKISQGSDQMIPDMRALMRMQRLLMDLSGDELRAQLEEIEALDIADDARTQLRDIILGVLTEKDPKLALDLFSTDSDAIGENWRLSEALRKWAGKDPAAAVAWLDKQIAEGKLVSKSLDGKNATLVIYESKLMGVLLKSDPAAAAARVKALPEEQREELFHQGGYHNLAKKDEAAYATLVRESLPAEKAAGILADTARFLAMNGGYERVDDFLTSTNASDDEKQSIVSKVLKSKSLEHGMEIDEAGLDKARSWASAHAPAVVNKATGEALAESARRDDDFGRVSELVLRYNETAGNDEVLAAFLKDNHLIGENKDEVMKLIDKIKDPALREEIRSLPKYHSLSDEP